MLQGVILVLVLTTVATFISHIDEVKQLGFSPLVVGIVLGMIYANSIGDNFGNRFTDGIKFSAKRILRFAIVFYGFRITFGEIYNVGLDGAIISILIVISTFAIGTYVGMRFFKLDRDTSMLTASGSSVCGAAAVLATEPVLKSESYKSAIAVSTVVFFGTIAMFLYPAVKSTGILDLNDSQFGIYVGATIHEVAQVVAVGGTYGGDVSNSAIIVKMTRVMLIAPMLIILGIILSNLSKGTNGQNSLVIPWFAVLFIVMSGINSLNIIPKDIVEYINIADQFLLTMAMTALGMETTVKKFKGVGFAPLYTAGIMFIWLLIGGYFITKLITEF